MLEEGPNLQTRVFNEVLRRRVAMPVWKLAWLMRLKSFGAAAGITNAHNLI